MEAKLPFWHMVKWSLNTGRWQDSQHLESVQENKRAKMAKMFGE
jgi:hypothetical protein